MEQVFCFENRGAEIGVTLAHPHGQIYGYPFVTPRTARMLRSPAAHHAAAAGATSSTPSLTELADGRVVLVSEYWVAYVPYAAHWPYEVHLYPHRRVPDLPALPEAARAEFPRVYLELLRRLDRIFGAGEEPDPVRLRPGTRRRSAAGVRGVARAISRCIWSFSPSAGLPASSSSSRVPSPA